MRRYGKIDLFGNELVDVLLESQAAAPGSPVTGRVYFNSTDAVAQVYDGSGWVDLNSPDDDFYNNLPNEPSPDGNDSILIYDDSALVYKRQSRDNFFQNITGYLPPPVGPAGSTTEIQYNDAGSFGASSKLLWSTQDNLIVIKTHSSAFSPTSQPGNHGLFIYNDNAATVLNKYAAIRFQSSYKPGYFNTSFIVSYASTASTHKSNLAFMTRDTAGNYETPLIIDGNVGVQIYYNTAQKFEADDTGFRVIGSATGDANLAYISFMESDNATRRAYVGFPSSVHNDFYINAEVGRAVITSTEGIYLTTWTGIGTDPLTNWVLRTSGGRINMTYAGTNTTLTVTNTVGTGAYSAAFTNKDTNNGAKGIWVQTGPTDQSSSQFDYVVCIAGDGITAVGYLRNNYGVFDAVDPSDERLKANIVDTGIDATQILKDLAVRDFNFIKPNNKPSY